jgi:hypothetical protein
MPSLSNLKAKTTSNSINTNWGGRFPLINRKALSPSKNTSSPQEFSAATNRAWWEQTMDSPFCPIRVLPVFGKNGKRCKDVE